jgi:hypothetical protein
VRRPAGLLVALAALAACGGDRADAERAVRAYDAALIAAYRGGDPAPLAPVATAREVQKVTALLDLKRAGGLVLESALEMLEVGAVERPERDRLRVRTRERWRYFDRRAAGGQAGETLVALVELDYDLVREEGAWKVAATRGRSTEYLEPKGYRPHHGAAREAGGRSPSP